MYIYIRSRCKFNREVMLFFYNKDNVHIIHCSGAPKVPLTKVKYKWYKSLYIYITYALLYLQHV